MTKTNDRREFLLKSASAAAVVASSAALSACGESLTPAEYRYGVASGDPLTDRVILWTHAKSIDSNLSVPLTYEVATDSAFSTIVKSGSCLTSPETGFTTKVDVTGLSAGHHLLLPIPRRHPSLLARRYHPNTAPRATSLR